MMDDRLKTLLEFYEENGATAILSDEPINQFQAKTTTIKTSAEKLSGTATHPALAAQSLPELRQAMEQFNECSLKKTALNTVFSDGNPNAKIMFVGEAPGADEDTQGLPFVGQSGQLLDRAISTIGLDRTSVYISNIIPWRPPGNRPPTTQEIAQCQPFIEKHISLIKPKLLVLLGGVAAKTLLNMNDGIMKIRGRWLDYHTSDGNIIPIMATFHPAFLLRSPGQKAQVWRDLLSIKQKLENL